MARVGEIQPHSTPRAAQVIARTEILTRQARVQELRQLVERGEYKIDPQRLALKILVTALRDRGRLSIQSRL